jgi:hypothetical protein
MTKASVPYSVPDDVEIRSHSIVNHFDPTQDVIVIQKTLTTSVNPQDVSGNAVITLDNNGDVITLVGVHASDLHTSNFQFV